MNNCTFPRSYSNYPNSCKCILCLRQPPTLRDLATHSFFHLTFNLSEFQLTARTLYHHYLYAANSHVVPQHMLIPHMGICLRSAYAHPTLCGRENNFHEYCIPDCDICCRSFDNYTFLVMRRLSQHCVSTEIDGGVRFVMGPYSSLLNDWWIMLVNKTQQTAW